MRIVKDSSVRKNEILDAAALLFAKKGFDNTSVVDIMDAVGIAKGTLYHHFKSKESIMDELIERETSNILSAAKKVAEDKSIPVKERMIRTILALHVDTNQAEEKEMVQHLHHPQNMIMHQKTKRIIFQRVPPIMTDILKDGITEGVFETQYPLECMEMALSYLDIMLDDDMFELTEEQRQDKILAFIYHLERLLGVKTGELKAFERAFQERQGEI